MSSSKLNVVGRIPLFVAPVMGMFLTAWPAFSQSNIDTLAGNGRQGFSGDGGPAAAAGLNHPRGLAVDASGSVYVGDADNLRVRRISPNGMISTVAGNGYAGNFGDGGPAMNASLGNLTGLALDAAGNLYIADAHNMCVRKVTPGGMISTVAGINGLQGFSGDGGPATSARLNVPAAVMFSGGNLYIADSSNQRIRRVSGNGTITTIAGNSAVAGFAGDGGPATSALLAFPLGMATDSVGNLYFADGDNNRVRRISPGGVITTVAGNGAGRFAGDAGPATSASLNIPEDVAIDGAGNLLIADSGNNRVRKVDSAGLISTLAGTAGNGFSGDGGLATQAMLDFPWAVATGATGNVYIADRVNNRVRMISGSVTASPPTLAADGAVVNGASFAKIAIAPGAIITIFGTGLAGSTLSSSGAPLPTVLADTSVTFNGIAAPLFFVSSSQINAQAPFDLQAGSASIQVKRGSVPSVVRTVSVATVSPGIFILDQASGAGAVLHSSDFSLVGSDSPARPGEYLAIYCTGLGPVKIPVKSGDISPSVAPLAETVYLPTVNIAGVPAFVAYSGLAPSFVGLYQVNVQVPAGLPTGSQPLQIVTLGVASNAGTIAVGR
jgi:uncharacterized protein (TIGR03437 family)